MRWRPKSAPGGNPTAQGEAVGIVPKLSRVPRLRRRRSLAADLTWPQLEQCVRAGAVGVLPVGVACKEYGPRLPMCADLLQARCLAETLVRRAPFPEWPAVSYGYYPAFRDYPGNVSLSRDTFQIIAFAWGPFPGSGG